MKDDINIQVYTPCVCLVTVGVSVGIRPLEQQLQSVPMMWVLGTNPGPLHQQVFLTAEPPLQFPQDTSERETKIGVKSHD